MKNDFLLLVVMALTVVAAVVPVSGEDTGTITIDQLLHMDIPGPISLSPDGNYLVYLKSYGAELTPEFTNNTLMLIDLRTGDESPVSGDSETVISFDLSPDGTKAAYAAVQKDSGDTVLKVVSPDTLEVTEPKNVPEALLSGFRWLNEDELAFLEEDSGNETITAGYEDDTIVFDEMPNPVVLKKYSILTGESGALSDNDDVITIWSTSPGGRYILYKASENPEKWTSGALFRYMLLDASTGEETFLFNLTEGYEDINAIAWEPDGSVVYIERMQNGGMTYPVRYTTEVLAYYPGTGEIEEVPLNWEKGIHIDLFNEDVELEPFNGGFYALLADGANPKLAMYTRTGSGWDMKVLSGTHEGNIFAIETTPDGKEIVYDFNSAGSPPQLFSAGVSGSTIQGEKQLTDLNPEIASGFGGSSEVIHWTGALGDEVEGIVRYPPGYTEGQKYPFVFVIHGGPTYTDFDSWRDTWEFPYCLISEKGAVLLSVNYHGSTNYGFDFAESIEGGHYYDLPVEDLLSGKGYLEEQGIIDPSLTASTGWSNGGILTLALITKDNSLKAAIAGAGTAEDQAQNANTNGMIMTKMYYGDSPYQDPEMFLDILPVYKAANVTTPLLMMIGTEDANVEPASAITTYRTYLEGSSAPVRFLMFPGEKHHPTTYAHQYRKVEEELGWLDTYLF
jgi:dipeptidyl aminopeptidase/acylaminoacyl peptidase